MLVFILLFVIISCKNNEDNDFKENVTIEENIPKKPIDNETLNQIETFFKNVSKIEIYSYLDRNKWDNNDNKDFRHFTSFKDGKINIKNEYIKEKIYLDQNQILKVKEVFKAGSFNDDDLTAMCYDPRHLLVFYNSKNEIIAYIEICFDCFNFDSSKNVEMFAEFAFNLLPYLKEFGIKYYKDTKQDIEDYYKRIENE